MIMFRETPRRSKPACTVAFGFLIGLAATACGSSIDRGTQVESGAQGQTERQTGPSVTVPSDWLPLPDGVALVGAGAPGSLAGYVYNADLSRFESPPVYGGHGELVGYVVANVGFVAKDTFESPDFDPRVEEVRRYGEEAVLEREALQGQTPPGE